MVHSNLLNFTTPLRRPMVFLLSEGINGARLWAFYENSIRPVEVKPSSLSSTITMKFLMSTQPRDPQNSECHPEGEDSGCASLRLPRISSHHPLPWCAEVEGAARLQLNPWPLQTVERSNFQGNKNNHGNRDAVCDSWPLENRLISPERLFGNQMSSFRLYKNIKR